MKPSLRLVAVLFMLLLAALAQNKGVTVASEERLNQLLPKTVFIDGENVPTQARNASLAQLPNGKIVIFSLIDTAGYSSAYQEKYTGVLMAQSGLTLGGKALDAGQYALGRKKNGDAVALMVYTLGGEQVAELATRREDIKPIKPLQIAVANDGSARLFLGPYYVALAGR